ncbi:hypothetical protein CTAM01_00479 [Colletotrichum tamarilloi]|uniref:Uncharacterized protein n=1 Tax=Colletotrichum tamarilloi TaxID=1209934 RepID=A0ABQ9RUP1_9PEZI|nr:uncharacterized protein CTAM01_00479 [Colletotrichum tamarilloi]KAK1513083.1 hypothetical protein CTAM01_00479 [Colletotrichum tamarilloi]
MGRRNQGSILKWGSELHTAYIQRRLPSSRPFSCGYSQPSFAPPLPPWTLALHCDMGKPALGFAKDWGPRVQGGGASESEEVYRSNTLRMQPSNSSLPKVRAGEEGFLGCEYGGLRNLLSGLLVLPTLFLLLLLLQLDLFETCFSFHIRFERNNPDSLLTVTFLLFLQPLMICDLFHSFFQEALFAPF